MKTQDKINVRVGPPWSRVDLVDRWLCNPRVSGTNAGTGNLEKVVYLEENSWTHTKSL